MAITSVLGPRAGRFLALALGLPLATALWLGTTPSAAQEKTQEKPADKAEKKSDDKPEPARAAPKKIPGLKEGAEVVQVINEKLAEQWKANKLTPSARCTDYEFIRRASLDLIGRIAKPDEIERFLKDPVNTRRALLVERLLASEEYAGNMANLWTVWLLTRGGSLEAGRGQYHDQMHRWLADKFALNDSWKNVVSELLTAAGKTSENGAVNFILTHLGEVVPPNKRDEEGQFDMVPITSRTSRLFLGLQTQCTQCHDHPFNPDRKQIEFWALNAFFRQVTRDGQPPAGRMQMATTLTLAENTRSNGEGMVFYERRDGRLLSARPAFLLEPEKDGEKKDKETLKVNARELSDKGLSRRQELARYVTGSDYFPRAYVNRMWAHFFGRGFTNPVDDFGQHNEPSHPELLDELARAFAHYGYDTKKLIRWICNSSAYQLSSVANHSNAKTEVEPYFSRMLLKAMSPEQLFESLMVATRAEAAETKDGRRDLRDRWMRNLIVNFGDDEGNEVTFNGTVVQALLLMNGKEISDALTSPKATVAQVLAKRKSNQAVVNDLFLIALNRTATPTEMGKITAILNKGPGVKSPPAMYVDLYWALLNSNEFILNH